MNPKHPGAFTWLDARTLQFRPSEPWPSLARFQWKAEEAAVTLTTLMATPIETLPANASDGIDAVKEITLTFAEPLDSGALAQMLSIELRPAAWNRFRRSPLAGSRRLSDQNQRAPIAPGSGVLYSDFKGTDSFGNPRHSSFPAVAGRQQHAIFLRNCIFHRRAFSGHCRRLPRKTISAYDARLALQQGTGNQLHIGRPHSCRGVFSDAAESGCSRRTESYCDSLRPSRTWLFRLQGRTLEISGDFAWDTLYSVGVVPAASGR